MSFLFNWLGLGSLDIRGQANEALNNMSVSFFPQRVWLKKLLLGTSAPRFEVLDIIDLHEGRFKGLFKFQYQGEMDVTLNSALEINALRLIDFDQFTKPHFVLADKSTIMPVDFNLRNVRIDAILTVVYNGKNITVVFNDTPIIDLEIKTSIDELLDAELFETMKSDTLSMATEFLKQDLPELISQAKLFDDEMQDMFERSLKASESVNTRVSFDGSSPISAREMDINIYNTLSLEPKGFQDVIQRISLSHKEFQLQDLSPQRDLGRKKRRVIKMGEKSTRKTSSSKSTHSINAPVDMNTRPTTPTIQLMSQTPSQETNISHSSSPTLIDSSFMTTASLDEFLASNDTLIFDNKEEPFELEDPYENLTHPMDIVPEYECKSLKLLIPETKLRPRGASSNYMKFGDFKYDENASQKAESEVMTF